MSGLVRDQLRDLALRLPDAWEDHPWGEDVAKVGKKIFVFLGTDGAEDPHMGVKLGDSHDQAVSTPGVTPSGYGLGRSGWVTVPLDRGLPVDVLADWVEESYRLVAPKRLVARLEQHDRRPN